MGTHVVARVVLHSFKATPMLDVDLFCGWKSYEEPNCMLGAMVYCDQGNIKFMCGLIFCGMIVTYYPKQK